MKKLLAILLCLIFVGLCACGKPVEEPMDETTAMTTIATEITEPPQEDEEPLESMRPSYALTATRFYAVGKGGRENAGSALLYVPLDNLSQVRRVPLPIHYEGKWLRELRIDSVDDKWITLTVCAAKEYYQADTEIAYVRLRVALDTFSCEFFGESKVLPNIEQAPQAEYLPVNEAEKALIYADGNEGILNYMALNGICYCIKQTESDHGISLYSIDENGAISDALLESRWSRFENDKLERLGDMILWINESQVVALYDPVTGQAFQADNYYNNWDWEALPKPEYEFTLSYAKTPTHIFASRGGELYRMPLNDIAQQEKISLPKKFDDIAISGLTKQCLYVSGGRTNIDEGSSYPRLLSTVTYRISLETLKVEQVDESEVGEIPRYGIYPRYNAASNSLLYVRDHAVEALKLDTGKRSKIFDFDGYYLGDSCVRGWLNAPDGEVVLDILGNWWDGPTNYAIFGKGNAVRMSDRGSYWFGTEMPEHKPNRAEKELEKRNDIDTYVTCGDYVYYVERTEEIYDDYYRVKNLYRMKTDSSNNKLLRAKTNIFSLMAVNDNLCCLAWLPSHSEEMGFYALDENGKVTRTIGHGYDGEWGGSGWRRFGELIMFNDYMHGSAEDELLVLYDPSTGAVFSRQELGE